MFIVKYIQNLQNDKKLHYILGIFYSLYIIFGAFLGYFLSIIYFNDNEKCVLFGATIGFVIALLSVLGKELLIDWYLEKGTPEFMDFTVNMAAPTITYLAFLIGIYLK